MDAARLEEWLSEFVERRERGEALTLEAFAREHPEGGATLLDALRTLLAAEELLPSGAPDLPARVGRYRVRGEIGRGGMGRVLEVDDPDREGGTLALKLLHVSVAHQPRALERFRREGKALERLVHPWIVRVHEAGLVDERPFLAMERVEGRSLADYLHRARERAAAEATGSPPARSAFEWLELPGEGHPLERIARLVARLARALAAAHREGVLHRDLNPRNVLVRPGGEPVVIDFGLMRASGAPTLTGSGDLLGTPQYMSPEQARGERVDERSDVFGLGVILRECLTLEPPRAAEDTLALVREASTRPLGPFGEAARGTPRALQTIVRRATSFFPRWRYPSCEALAGDLELFGEDEPIRARAPGPVQTVAEALHVHRRLALTVALVLAALAIGLVLRGLGGHEDARRRRIEGATDAFVAWMAGDASGARAALQAYRESETDPPLVDYLDALIEDDLARTSEDPAARAMLAGERALRAGRPDEALSAFRTAWDVSPDFPFVVLMQGMAALEAGQPEVARPELEASTKTFGGTPRLHWALARVYDQLDQPEDEQRALRAVVALTPDDARAWLALARAQQELGEDDDALASATKALALDAGLSDELRALAQEWEEHGAATQAAALLEKL